MQLLLIKNFFKLGIFKYSEDLLIFIGSIIISRLVAPSEYGVVAIVNIFYGFLNRFSDIGLTAFIIREEESKSRVIAVQFFFVILSILLSFILILLAYPISLFYSKEIFAPCITYAFIILVTSLPKASSALLLKNQNFDYIAKIGVISTILTLCLTITLAFLRLSYWVLIIPQFLPPLISLYFYRKKVKIPFMIPPRSDIKKTFQQCRKLIRNLTIFTTLSYWARNTDNFLIGKLYGKGDLGIYNRAYSFSNLPINMIGRVFSKIQLPIFQKQIDNLDLIMEQYKRLLHLLTSLIVIPFTLLYLFAQQIVVLLWGKNWTAVADYLPLISILMLVFIINITVNDMFILLKKDKYIVVSALITGTASIISLAIGAFISIKVMIYMYVITALLVNSPAIIYIGFYKTFKFNFKEIIEIWLSNWLAAFIIILLNVFQLNEWAYLPIILLVMVSSYKFATYLKYLKTELKQEKLDRTKDE
jgi:O-antigen/teichoic acid export membrane protein